VALTLPTSIAVPRLAACLFCVRAWDCAPDYATCHGPPLSNHLAPLPPAPADAFRHCPLFIGGPVTRHLLHVLHARREVEGALEVVEVRRPQCCW
jgi:hypothetical protein